MNRGQSQYSQRGRIMRAAKRHAMQKHRAAQKETVSTPARAASRPLTLRSTSGSRPAASPNPLPLRQPRNGDAFYTEAQRHSASLWMWISFWLMLAFFLFCFVGLFAFLMGHGTWADVLKPAGWSLAISVFVVLRWSKLSRIEAGLLRQADQRTQMMHLSADMKAQETADHKSADHKSADAPQRKQEKHSLDFRLRSAEAALQSIKPEAVKAPVSAARSTNAFPWKSKAQRDEEWLDQETRWRLDTMHRKDANEEARRREERHLAFAAQSPMPEVPKEEQKRVDIERQIQDLERQIQQR